MWFKTPDFLIQKFLLSPWLLTTPAERLEALLTGREFPWQEQWRDNLLAVLSGGRGFQKLFLWVADII